MPAAAALDFYFVLVVAFMINSHIWPPQVAIFLALRVWEAFGAS